MVLAQQTYRLTKQGMLNKEIEKNLKHNEQELEQAKQSALDAGQKADDAVKKANELSGTIEDLDTDIGTINNAIKNPNLIPNPEPMFMLVDYPKTQDSVTDGDWQKLDNRVNNKEVLTKNNLTFQASPDKKVTQQVEIEVEGELQSLTFSFYANNQHNRVPATIKNLGNKKYIAYATWISNSNGNIRLMNIINVQFTGSFIKFRHPKLEYGDYTSYYINSEEINNSIVEVKQTQKGLQQTVSNLNGKVTQNTQTINGVQTTVRDHTGKITQTTQTINGLKTKVQDNENNISKVSQTVSSFQATIKEHNTKIGNLTLTANALQTSIKDLNTETSSKISQLNNNINAKVSKGDLVTQINLDPSGILIDGKKVKITGETYIQNGVITDAMIANLKVDKLTGDFAKFYKLLFEDGNSNMALTSDGIRFSELDKGNTWNNEYLEVNSGHLKWWSDGDHGQQYAYLGTAKRYRSMNITLGVVNNLNADNDFPTLALRSAGQNTFLTSRKSSIVSGSYVYIGNNTANYESSSLYDSFTSASTDGNTLSNTTSKVVLSAQNGVFFRPGTTKNDSVYFCKDYAWDSNSGIEFTRTDSRGMMIRAKGVYTNTGGDSPNLFIRSSGYIYRSTSARKYKEDIEYMHNLEQAKQLLHIDPASWIDKAEKEAFREGKERTLPRRVGFIADDFYRLGLTDVVVKDEKGEIEGLAYDKISIYIIPLLKDLYYKLGVLEKEINELKGKNKQ